MVIAKKNMISLALKFFLEEIKKTYAIESRKKVTK